MNTVYQNAPQQVEAVPLQGGPYPTYPGQFHGTTAVGAAGGQHTIVFQPEPPRDYIIWSLCCFLHSNPFCLGLAALIFSIKSRDRKIVGDLEGARRYGSTARLLNIVATVILCITAILLIIVFSVISSQVYTASRRYYGK